MGLNSGDVVVGQIGDDLRMDYTAQGHTVGLAQRTEQLAEAGRTYLTEHTAALVGGYFRLRDLGAFTLKGVRLPVHIHELEAAGASRTRLDVARTRGFSRFVGRADEMAAVDAAMARALAGEGRVIGVVGEPGVGKSRLCHELAEQARAQGVRVHTAHCVAHGKMVPFLPVLELMRDFFGLTEEDGDEAARRKIAGTLLLLDPALTDALPLVFDFLGVADPAEPSPRMDPEARLRRLFALAKQIGQARSRREPSLLLFEDLHWIDDSSAPFVETLVDAVPGTRALLLVNFRPEYHAGWMQKSHYQQLPLLPLGPEASRELLGELRLRPIGRGARRARRRAHGRQPVLRRGGRPDTRRSRESLRLQGRVSPPRAGGDARPAGVRPGRARRAHRSAARAREAGAADGRSDRQGVRRAGSPARRGSSRVRARGRAARARPGRTHLRDGALSGGRIHLQTSVDPGGGVRLAARRAAETGPCRCRTRHRGDVRRETRRAGGAGRAALGARG